MKILPTTCPACNGRLKVKSLVCEKCQTEIQGQFDLPALASLSPDDQAFVLEFIKASGSLKDMAKLLGLSYPTIRNRLDEIIKKIADFENHNEKRDNL
jgi:hypothetical protein